MIDTASLHRATHAAPTLDVVYAAAPPAGTQAVLIPGGLATPHGTSAVARVEGAASVSDARTACGQVVLVAERPGVALTVVFRLDPQARAPYPDALFTPRPSRFTRYADDLVAEVAAVAEGLDGLDKARAVARHVAERFTYGHPEARFNDGFEVVPALGCGVVEGSCVDINTYFIAALRAVGLEAGYVTGFFFPAEKGDHCEDGHCWVVTRIGGATQEWDIAHHLKMGVRDIQPALDPKPGRRVACFHSMGIDAPTLGVAGVKALIEPLPLVPGVVTRFDAPRIRLRAPAPAA